MFLHIKISETERRPVMKYTRSRSVAFILYWLILATFIQVITQIPSVAATGDPWELTTIADELTAQEETPSMIFQPDGPVRTLSDLAPTGTKVTELPVDWAETVTPVKIEIDETADVALGFGGNEVGLVIEERRGRRAARCARFERACHAGGAQGRRAKRESRRIDRKR
jgi:hypothetical protein